MQQVFAAGADDLIHKPILGPELVTRALSRLERVRPAPPAGEKNPPMGPHRPQGGGENPALATAGQH